MTLKEELLRIGFKEQNPKGEKEGKKDYSEYLDEEIVGDFISSISKKNLYHSPARTFSFKQKSGKLTNYLKVEEIMEKSHGRESSEYRILEVIKELGEATHSEISSRFISKWNTLRDSSIRTGTTRISSLVPDIVQKYVKDGNLYFKYVSKIGNGDLDAAYAQLFQNITNNDSTKKTKKVDKSPTSSQELKTIKNATDKSKEMKINLILKYLQRSIIRDKDLSEEELEILRINNL